MVEQPSLCTVLVAAAVKRTIKFMSAFALGVPIVTPAWVTKSKQAKCFLGTLRRHDVGGHREP